MNQVQSSSVQDEALEGRPLRGVEPDVAGVRVNDRIVAFERVVAEDALVRCRVGCEVFLRGQLEYHGGRGRDIFVHVAFAVTGEDEYALASQVGGPVVGALCGAACQQAERGDQSESGFHWIVG